MAEALTKWFVILQFWFLLKAVIINACEPPCLYFSAGSAIKSIQLSSPQITSNATVHAGRAIAVAVDVEENLLYWSDKFNLSMSSIKRVHLQSGKIEIVVDAVGDCEGISIEWMNKYIYWTDKWNNRIEMSRVDGTDRKLLFDNDLENPRGITVDPVHGYIFWTDYDSVNPKIERATLAGQERTTIISRSATHKLTFPNDIIVDYKESKLYWVDAGLDVVGKADLDGSNIQLSEAVSISHLFAIALHNNILYLSDMEPHAKAIRLMDKQSLKEFSKYTKSVIESRDLMGLTVFQGSRQPLIMDSPCSHGNGKCSHFCFIVPGGYRCGCPDGTALRKDGFSCQEANFTNCRNQPCQNGGTCYFDFDKLSEECSCKTYYEGKDCGLYLGTSAVRIILEMRVNELDEEKFKPAIVKGLHDYCTRNDCSLRNKTIAQQFCLSFLNTSVINATRVTIIGQPTELSIPNHTQVDFALILPAVTSPKPKVVLNTTLKHVILKSANFISKHLGGYKTLYVNNQRPPSGANCAENDGNNKGVENGVDGTKETTGVESTALILGIIFGVVVVLIAATLWYRRNWQKDNNPGGNIEVIHNNLDQNIVPAEGNENMGALAPPDLNIIPNREAFNDRVLREGRVDCEVQNCDIQQQGNLMEGFSQQIVGNHGHLQAMERQNVAGNQPRDNSEGYINPIFRELDSQQPQEDYEDIESENVPGNQARDNSNQQDYEVYENEHAQRIDNLQSEPVYEEIDAPQAQPVRSEICNSVTVPTSPSSAIPHYAVDQRDCSNNHDNQMNSPSDVLGREAVEHDDSGGRSGIYATAVQCTDE